MPETQPVTVCDAPPTSLPADARTLARMLDPGPARPAPAAHPEARALIEGLMRPQARISPKYLYDRFGSRLFELITELPEYYVTRTEQLVMARHARSIGRAVGRCGVVIEPGAGNCDKALKLCGLLDPAHMVAIDIAGPCLQQGARALKAALPWVQVHAVEGDITLPLQLPEGLPRSRRLVFYPGTSIGNFEPDAALRLLQRLRALVDDDGALLIGIDLVKDASVLEAAYDDLAGVTAAFNRNVLRHVNRRLGSDFRPTRWKHVATWNARHARVELELEAQGVQAVGWPGGGRRFDDGDRILTEYSHKYTVGGFADTLAAAGWRRHRAWTDERGWFAVVLARP